MHNGQCLVVLLSKHVNTAQLLCRSPDCYRKCGGAMRLVPRRVAPQTRDTKSAKSKVKPKSVNIRPLRSSPPASSPDSPLWVFFPPIPCNSYILRAIPKSDIMAPISIADIVAALPAEDTWGPATASDNMLQGVPYAPFSKGDKLGRMADWTAESKDPNRAGRQAYNRNYRGIPLS